MVQMWVCAGLLSYSAVPVFAITGPPGTPASPVAVPAVTTSRIIWCSESTEVALSALPSAGTGLADGPGLGEGAPGGMVVNSTGCFHEPRATAATAPPMAIGLTT